MPFILSRAPPFAQKFHALHLLYSFLLTNNCSRLATDMTYQLIVQVVMNQSVMR